MQFDRGFLSPYFVTDVQKMECELEDPYILIYEKKISSNKDLIPVLEKGTSDYDKEKLSERIAKLSGGVAKINVGAATESEMKEKKARVEDAMHATRAAVQEGILPGGGVALLRASEGLKPKGLGHDEDVGYNIVVRACKAPITQIAENAGMDGAIVAAKVQENTNQNFGY